ncbi:MAG: hypothetical protein OEU76_05780, partial [Cyclobacteriaceae bacterium]|nr:hypothetical protein [Cyclobacteriaceae bacterium]
TASFKEGGLNQVLVEGNGESIFFALEDKTNLLTGVNKIICSNIVIRFVDSRVNNLSFYVKPEADFIPPHELKKENTVLKGLQWRGDSRPSKADVKMEGKQEKLPDSAAPKRSRM